MIEKIFCVSLRESFVAVEKLNPLSEQQLLEQDQQRDFNAELLQSVDEMVSGCVAAHHHIDLSDIVKARQNVGASQSTDESIGTSDQVR